ncbi:MAG TPA: glycoside hydrolase family 15 protein, partial [Candidatus Paceibacterota bacterium]|nr:glycoside hydrolase family 15 protein [Candidatus Paceibacterota bacterium]
LASYRDPYTGLPKPSYNLWEERFGVHTYTAATVYAGLTAAAKFAEILGKERGSHNFEHVATEMQRAILKHLYNAENGTFYKAIYIDKNGKTIYDLGMDASSAYGIYQFGVLPPDDPRIASAMQLAKDRLTVRTSVGGIARYEGDQYYRTVQDVPGNPWFITTLWFAQYYCALAKNDHDLDRVREILEWARRNALPSGVLSEQLDPYTGAQVSAGPLTWSHAEYIRTVVQYLRKVQSLGIARTIPDRL